MVQQRHSMQMIATLAWNCIVTTQSIPSVPTPPTPLRHLSFLFGKAANSPQLGWEAPGGSLRALLHGGGEPQIGEVTCGGSPNGDHVNLIKWKWKLIWTGGLPHLSGLHHLPGAPHLHVNRPLKNPPPPPSRQYQNFIFLQMTGNHVLGREAVPGQGSDVDLD